VIVREVRGQDASQVPLTEDDVSITARIACSSLSMLTSVAFLSFGA
jgi:hypothetical protein